MDQTFWLNAVMEEAMVEGEEVEVLGTRPLVEKGQPQRRSL